MRRFSAVALLLTGLALPACAQRGGGHGGGFSGHAASSFHSGFSAPSASGFASAPRFGGSASFRPPAAVPGFGASAARNFYSAGRAPYSGGRSPYSGSNRYRRGYNSPYFLSSPYFYPGYYPGYYPWSGYDSLPDSSDYAPAANDVQQAYAPQQEFAGDQRPRMPYFGSAQGPSAVQVPQNEDAVTLVFRDGRPSEQIHNYALTRTTLYVLDEHRRDISVDELDLDATAKVNRDAGVDFQLPIAR
ncbi:hypothetical protein HNQ77_002761 [Silvibacterium bohemicum]|uniref:Uncharacterized protein n=1 Tax=Silvibacterium bohemicum TaxID=1577686 RepID=A0A841JW79_9BACT|nr:hypothetical protein [Silvibacterium bohemicum]MBB6144805.1 hypothetical protein [Silvibacterium bohemicum]